MTLLQRSDRDDASAGASYLEFVELLARVGAQADRDMEELWPFVDGPPATELGREEAEWLRTK